LSLQARNCWFFACSWGLFSYRIQAGLSVNDFFAPACPIFISHTWSDGTGEFVGRLKDAIEEQTLVSVWVDMQGIDQVKRVIRG
jgi:hypothetical protein